MFLRRLLVTLIVAAALACGVARACAQGGDPKLIERLNDEQRKVYFDWRAARSAFERQNEAYWSAISARRTERRRKMAAGEQVTSADFVMSMPPKYAGPALRPDIARIQAELQQPTPPGDEITSLPEMLAAAKQLYRFEPSIVPEREFKRRYAIEALALGLTKEDVTRIYAFETGGRGTFDMQAGINPDTKAGKPISTAMGYAQLLAANSIDELVRSGDGFISRLSMMAARPGTPHARVQELTAKIEAIRAMLRTARSVPKEWSRHVELARTPRGFAIHVLNLDGDVGPWLQVIKLKGIRNTAEQAGLTRPAPAELEIMNLAGPKTGLEMMTPVGRMAPTANFFTQAAYLRNTIVREKTAAELLAAIDGRMGENMLKAGSQEFATVFDEISGRPVQQAIQTEGRQQLLPARSAPMAPPSPPMRPYPSQPPQQAAPYYAPQPSQAVTARPTTPPPRMAGEALPVPSVGLRSENPPAGFTAPAPVRASQPVQPAPRADWAPPQMRAPMQMPQGFPD